MPIEFAAPPPKSTPNTSGASSPSRRATPRLTAEREEAVAQLGMFAQVPLMATRQLADAAAIGIYWPKISHEVAKLAESQESVAQVIDPLIRVGPYAGLIAATLPLVMQLAVNHGRVKPGIAGTVPAVSLQSQMETEIAKAELHALRVQQEAEEQAAAARKEIQASRDALNKAQMESVDVSA
jgi:hypothetical protein